MCLSDLLEKKKTVAQQVGGEPGLSPHFLRGLQHYIQHKGIAVGLVLLWYSFVKDWTL